MNDPFALVGTTIAGKYRVERVIGEGGFGVVYAGVHLGLSQPIAIKCLKPVDGVGGTDFTLATFLREARLLFALTHPGIVRLYDVGELVVRDGAGSKAAPYVVLELIEGRTLHAEIQERRVGRRPPFSRAEIGKLCDDVLSALSFAHASGVVHRDVKPSNIMVVTRGDSLAAKVLDFGMAGGPHGGASTTVLGLTPRYASPEQWDTAYGAVGAASDLFSMGLVLEEICTLAPTIQGSNVAELMAAVLDRARAPRIRHARPDLAALDAVVAGATRVSPPERYPSADAMLHALRQALAWGAGGAAVEDPRAWRGGPDTAREIPASQGHTRAPATSVMPATSALVAPTLATAPPTLQTFSVTQPPSVAAPAGPFVPAYGSTPRGLVASTVGGPPRRREGRGALLALAVAAIGLVIFVPVLVGVALFVVPTILEDRARGRGPEVSGKGGDEEPQPAVVLPIVTPPQTPPELPDPPKVVAVALPMEVRIDGTKNLGGHERAVREIVREHGPALQDCFQRVSSTSAWEVGVRVTWRNEDTRRLRFQIKENGDRSADVVAVDALAVCVAEEVRAWPWLPALSSASLRTRREADLPYVEFTARRLSAPR